jgi:DNA-binding CsgD family transcriptional regulator
MMSVDSAKSKRRRVARPAIPPRQRWWVDPDTWDPERVIDACAEWARQTGAAPSYYDWSPVDRARAAGSATALAVKWEREHPTWPSTSVVYRHLGSWRGMLLLAGFPAPAPLELSFAERVRETLRLRGEGRRWKEIGELLGISPDTARRYVHAADCEECGEPVLRARRCRRCSARDRTRWGAPYSRAEIVAAIQAWQRLESRAPAIVDWRPEERGGHARWERECPRFPPVSHVTRAFGSWNAALQAAGFDRPRPPAYSDQEILDALRADARRRGVSSLSSQWDGHPDRNVIAHRFGSWNAALTAAGLAPRRVRPDWSDEQILDGLRRFATDHGRPPRARDRVGSLGRYPSPALAVSRFGSWSAALVAAGLQPGNPPPLHDAAISDALRAYQDHHGASPSSSTWHQRRLSPSAEAIIRRCGSWAAALELAGLPACVPARQAPGDAEILERLRAYAREFGVAPSSTAWRRQQRTPGTTVIARRFGSWPAALQRAGL